VHGVARSQWPRDLRRSSAAARLLGLWVWIPLGALMFVWCECCVLLGRGLCDGLITRPEEFYRLWCVVACDLETSWMRRPWPPGGCCAPPTPQKKRMESSINTAVLNYTVSYFKQNNFHQRNILENKQLRRSYCPKWWVLIIYNSSGNFRTIKWWWYNDW